MKILITGSSGFVGTHLCKELYRLKHTLTKVDLVEGVTILDTLRMIELCQNQDAVIHLAAKTSVQESNTNIFPYNQTNIQGTLSVLEAVKVNKVPQFIFASSAAVYEPNSVYAVTKLAGEYYIKLYSYLYGFNSVILRFFNIYGKGSKGIIPIFLNKLKCNEPLIIYGGYQTRDFIHIDDIVSAIILSLGYGKQGTFDIGTGKSYSIDSIAQKCMQITGKKVDIIYKPDPIGEVKHSKANLINSINELGFIPEISIDEGIGKLI